MVYIKSWGVESPIFVMNAGWGVYLPITLIILLSMTAVGLAPAFGSTEIHKLTIFLLIPSPQVSNVAALCKVLMKSWSFS